MDSTPDAVDNGVDRSGSIRRRRPRVGARKAIGPPRIEARLSYDRTRFAQPHVGGFATLRSFEFPASNPRFSKPILRARTSGCVESAALPRFLPTQPAERPRAPAERERECLARVWLGAQTLSAADATPSRLRRDADLVLDVRDAWRRRSRKPGGASLGERVAMEMDRSVAGCDPEGTGVEVSHPLDRVADSIRDVKPTGPRHEGSRAL